jgi:hypothetical protein
MNEKVSIAEEGNKDGKPLLVGVDALSALIGLHANWKV